MTPRRTHTVVLVGALTVVLVLHAMGSKHEHNDGGGGGVGGIDHGDPDAWEPREPEYASVSAQDQGLCLLWNPRRSGTDWITSTRFIDPESLYHDDFDQYIDRSTGGR